MWCCDDVWYLPSSWWFSVIWRLWNRRVVLFSRLISNDVSTHQHFYKWAVISHHRPLPLEKKHIFYFILMFLCWPHDRRFISETPWFMFTLKIRNHPKTSSWDVVLNRLKRLFIHLPTPHAVFFLLWKIKEAFKHKQKVIMMTIMWWCF